MFFSHFLMVFLNPKISVNWSKFTHKMTIFFLSSFFYLQFLLQKFKSPHLDFFFKLLFVNFLWTSLLQCWTALYWRVELHCTALTCDRWYLDMWNVSPPPLRPSVCTSFCPYLPMSICTSPTQKSSILVSGLLSASVERFGVSWMRNFFSLTIYLESFWHDQVRSNLNFKSSINIFQINLLSFF